MRYIPKLGKLYFCPNIVLKIKLAKSKAPFHILHHFYRGLPEDRERIKRDVINPEVIETYPSSSKSSRGESYKYAIITNDSLMNLSGSYTFSDLINHKKSKGITATMTSTAWIYENFSGEDNQEKIRNFIKYTYENWETDYILLGGDTSIIPYRGLYAQAEDKVDSNIPADLYYACLNGNFNNDGDDKWGESNDGEGGGDVDLIAEVYVGRAPVETFQEVSNFVKKTNWIGKDCMRWCYYCLNLFGDPETVIWTEALGSFFDWPIKPKNEWTVYEKSGFGDYRESKGYHSGEDWNWTKGDDLGKPVYAIGDGIVYKKDDLGTDGWCLVVKHTAPQNRMFKIPARQTSEYSYPEEYVSEIFSVYIHITNIPFNIDEKVGKEKDDGIIGYIMNPGSGPHLHFEIRHPNAKHSSGGSMLFPITNWAPYGNENTNGHYLNMQTLVDSGARCPSDFLISYLLARYS